MPSTPRATSEDQESKTATENEGPALVMVDTSYDEHYFVGSFASKDEANAFIAELGARTGGPFETKVERLVSKDDLFEQYPEPQEPELTLTEQMAAQKAEQEKVEKEAAAKAEKAVA